MHRLSSKILALLIVVLMGLAPLQAAMASMGSPAPAMGESMPAMMHMDMSAHASHGAMDMSMDQAATSTDMDQAMMGCDQCQSDTCCAEQSCPSSHCASCATAIPTVFALSSSLASSAVLADFGLLFASAAPSSLYRPPRA